MFEGLILDECVFNNLRIRKRYLGAVIVVVESFRVTILLSPDTCELGYLVSCVMVDVLLKK